MRCSKGMGEGAGGAGAGDQITTDRQEAGSTLLHACTSRGRKAREDQKDEGRSLARDGRRGEPLTGGSDVEKEKRKTERRCEGSSRDRTQDRHEERDQTLA